MGYRINTQQSNVLRRFPISGGSVRMSEEEVSSWIQKLGMIS